MDNQIDIRICEDFYTGTVNLWIRQKSDGKVFMGEVVFKEYEKGQIANPALAVSLDDVGFVESIKQSLKSMGRLHFADEATLKSKDAHLEDMRTLVFKPKNGATK